MTDESVMAMRGTKTANIIICLSELYNISIDKATDMYYKSETSRLIEEGISDLHCRSDKYLATLIWEEYQTTADKSH